MKSPFKVLYSNDLTNIKTCVSPYHKQHEEQFRPEMLDATVDETADRGVDVHMLQPGLGWVPHWKSRAYPFEEHMRFVKEYFGEDPSNSGYATYLAGGGDIVKDFIDRCRQKNITPFISLRLNDCHGHEVLEAFHKEGKKVGAWAWQALTPIHVNHPDWRIAKHLTDDWNGRALNWAIPEVRQHKMAYIKEIIEQYDIDGFELDFMRHSSFFDVTQTSLDERVQIITEFVKEVRESLDRTSKSNQHRWLCARVPCYLEVHDRLGIDVKKMISAGVDMLNLSASYFTEQLTDMAEIRKMVPDASVYHEMCHCSQIGPFGEKGEYDEFLFRPVTPTQYYTTAHLAYSRGLAGVSTFNFVYYREHGLYVEKRGPFFEPPFDVLPHLSDPQWLAARPQHYFLGNVWNDNLWQLDKPLPQKFQAGQSAKFKMDMAAPTGGWKNDGRLRIQAIDDMGDSRWEAVCNGVVLSETEDRSEPYDNPYPQLLGTYEQHRAWNVPCSLLKDGYNDIEITLVSGAASEIVFLDLAVS